MDPLLKVRLVSSANGLKVGVLAALQPVELAAGVLATCKPRGKLSVKAMLWRTLGLGLVIWKCSTESLPIVMGLGAKSLVIAGGEMTVSVAVAGTVPLPPLLEDTLLLVFKYDPPTAEVTPTVTMQVVLTGILPPVNEIVLVPLSYATVPPLHCEGLGRLGTTTPDGNTSVKLTPVSGTVLAAGFLSVKVSVEVAFAAMVEGENALEMVGGAITTSVSQACAVLETF